MDLTLDVPAVEEALFERAAAIGPRYGVQEPFTDPSSFARRLIEAMQQPGVTNPTEIRKSPTEVFHAAVRSLGSNQTDWARYMAAEDAVSSVLHGFDPVAVTKARLDGRDIQADLVAALPRTTPGRTASRVLTWAENLTNEPGLYEDIQNLGRTIQAAGGISDHELLPMASLVLSADPLTRLSRQRLSDLGIHDRTWKLPGMGFALTAEFLRNLGWEGFKPDTHVKRLFNHWIGEEQLTQFGTRAAVLAAVVGIRSRDSIRTLRYSLAGLAITPTGCSPSAIDNLVWLIGANVQRARTKQYRNFLVSR